MAEAVQYNTIQYSTVQYSTLQYSTVHYITLQYITVQYITVQYSAGYSAYLLTVPSSVLKCVSPMHCATSSTQPTALDKLLPHRSNARMMVLTRSGGRIVGSRILSEIADVAASGCERERGERKSVKEY